MRNLKVGHKAARDALKAPGGFRVFSTSCTCSSPHTGWTTELSRCMGFIYQTLRYPGSKTAAETHDTTGWHCGAQCGPRLLRYAEGQWSVIDINERMRGSPAQTPWVCGAEEEESCRCHHYTDLWKKDTNTQNESIQLQHKQLNVFSEAYLSCDQQLWMKSFLPQRCPGEKQRTQSVIKQGKEVPSQPFANANFKEERSWHSRQSRWLMKTMKKSQLECLSKTSWSHLHLCWELGRSAGSASRGEERFGGTGHGGAEGQGSSQPGVFFKSDWAKIGTKQ